MADTHGTRRGSRFQDLTGKTFHRLTVLEFAGSKNRRLTWRCRCVCGTERVVPGDNLKSGNTTSCGCRQRENREGRNNPRFVDLTGQTFHQLTVLEWLGAWGGVGYWRCRCSCGNEAEVITERLVGGGTKSCGCRYEASRRHPDAAYGGIPLEERLWSRVKKTDGCWEWQGAKLDGDEGYGSIGVNGEVRRVHRVVYELVVGSIPEGLCVLHHCDNPKCCRPDHLFLGTYADNHADMRAKGRQYQGPRTWSAKLTANQVMAIWREYREGGVEQKQLARKYGISPGAVWRIVRGTAWRHVVAPLEAEACGP